MVIVLAVVALLLALLWALQRRLIYLPFPADVPPATAVLDGAREVTLRTADGLELGAWFIAPGEPDRRVGVLVATGNAGNRSLRAPLAEALARHGLAVLLFDYRGYGGNRGRPTQAGLARDARAALRFLGDDAGLPGHRLLCYGESLGAAVVTELATTHPPAGLVLRSPFVDLASVGRVHYRSSRSGPSSGTVRHRQQEDIPRRGALSCSPSAERAESHADPEPARSLALPSCSSSRAGTRPAATLATARRGEAGAAPSSLPRRAVSRGRWHDPLGRLKAGLRGRR